MGRPVPDRQDCRSQALRIRISFLYKEETMKKSIISHAVLGCATALLASFVTWLALAPESMSLPQAHAQTPPANTAARQTQLFKTTMNDVLGREVTIRRLERDAGTGSGPHRHPGSHTFGYVLEGTYEVKVDDGPLQKLGPGGTFYEPPGALHAVSRTAARPGPSSIWSFRSPIRLNRRPCPSKGTACRSFGLTLSGAQEYDALHKHEKSTLDHRGTGGAFVRGRRPCWSS